MMKRFKFWLVSLLLGLFWLTCFSSASFINYWQYTLDYSQSQYPFWLDDSSINFQQDWYLCVDYFLNSSVENWVYLTLAQSWNPDTTYQYYYISNRMGLLCLEISSEYSEFWSVWIELYDYSPTWYAWVYFFPSWSCPVIDTNYCVSNDLCPVSSWVSWSELVINDIVHESAPLINITIPEEYSWDYSVDENEFTLDISGYNVDYAYIDNIITTQKWKPNNIDFNNVITWLIPLLVPWLVIILFIWFIFRFIKKIF